MSKANRPQQLNKTIELTEGEKLQIVSYMQMVNQLNNLIDWQRQVLNGLLGNISMERGGYAEGTDLVFDIDQLVDGRIEVRTLTAEEQAQLDKRREAEAKQD